MMRNLLAVGVALGAVGVAATFGATSLAAGASSEGTRASVTSGELTAFAAGEGLDISGHARMVRTADGKTLVSLYVKGLQPRTTYGSHVHATPCAVDDADGHYKFDPNGPAEPPNEIWLGPFTTNPAGSANAHTRADATAGPTAVSVVVHAPDGSKIACADLG